MTPTMSVPTHPERDEQGSVSAWFAVASLVMVLCIGLAVDLGGHVHAQQRAHQIAAQAARTAGEEIAAHQAIRGQTPTVDRAAAKQAANTYLNRAGVTGTVTLLPDNHIQVRVADNYQTVFLNLIGINNLPATGEATARLARVVEGTEQ